MNDYKDLAERMLNALQSDQGINEEAGVLMIHAVNAIQALQARLEVTENAPDGVACRDMTIEMLEKRIKELEEERNAWRNAVIDELVTLNIACKKHEDDSKFAVRDCINYNVQLALDPAISSQAQELIDRGRAEERAEREKQKPVAWVTALDAMEFGSGEQGESAFLLREKGMWNVPLYLAPPVTSDAVNKAFADGKAEGHGDATEEASVVIGGLRARIAELEAELFAWRDKYMFQAGQFDSLKEVATKLAAERAEREEQEPVAYMRKWKFDGEEPKKERNESGKMAWPFKFKLHPVTVNRCLNDDIRLYAAPPVTAGISTSQKIQADKAIREALGDALDCDCTWRDGEMRRSNFTCVASCDDRVASIREAAFSAIGPAIHFDRLTDAFIRDCGFQHGLLLEDADSNPDVTEFAREIETAVLRANGFKVDNQ